MRVGVAIFASCILGGTAHADWRDGCPAGGTIGYFPSQRMGPSPDAESAFGTSRLQLNSQLAYFTSKVDQPRETTAFESALFHIGHRWFTSDIMTAVTHHVEGTERTTFWSGTVVKLGYRGDWFSDIDPNTILEPNSRLIHGLRKAFALRAVIGDRLSIDGDDSRVTAIADSRRMPFDIEVLHPGPILGGEAEYRIEVIGCHAPFVHVRAGILANENPAEPSMGSSWITTVTGSVTLGIHLDEKGDVLMLQYAALAQHVSSARYDNDQRWRIAYSNHATDLLTIGANLDYATRYDGLFFGVNIALEACIGEFPCTR